MSDDFAYSLLRSGILSAKEGQKSLAARYLERAIDNTKDYEILAEAWYWMSVATDDRVEKRKLLENALAYDLQHARARRDLAVLDGKLKPEEIVDPDAIPAPPAGPQAVEAQRFTCPKCGGRLAYAPDGRSLVCEFCSRGQALGVSSAPPEEEDFFIAMATARGHGKPVAMHTFHCQGCGAEFMLAPEVLSAVCAYCQSPYVIRLDQTRDLIGPEGIIPHAFTQRQAAKLLVEFIEKNKIEPQGMVAPPRGLYLPIWTFDLGGEISYSGEIVKYEGQTRKTVTVKDAWPVDADDLPIPASRKLSRRLARLLPTYKLRAAKPYDPRFLASWPAEVYDIPMADASLDARSQVYARQRRRLAEEAGPISNLNTSSARMSVESFKLVLLPVWITTYPYEGKDYQVLINGQTGAVEGETPKGASTGLMDWLEDLLGVDPKP